MVGAFIWVSQLFTGGMAARQSDPAKETVPVTSHRYMWLKSVLATIALVGLVISIIFSQDLAHGPDLSEGKAGGGYLLGSIYFVVMLAGMAAEYMFGLKEWKTFSLTEFAKPFWVALIVFSIPWSLVDKNTLTFGSVLACYQNGFFWKKVLERSRKR